MCGQEIEAFVKLEQLWYSQLKLILFENPPESFHYCSAVVVDTPLACLLKVLAKGNKMFTRYMETFPFLLVVHKVRICYLMHCRQVAGWERFRLPQRGVAICHDDHILQVKPVHFILRVHQEPGQKSSDLLPQLMMCVIDNLKSLR